jgi:pyruvate formate lyase activating enzyme
MQREAEYWEPLENGKIHCLLCPHSCRLAEGQPGLCKARYSKNQTLTIPYYGLVSSMAIDPIEKKPLRHYLPGSHTFSVGFWHCTMRCPFCQNWEIAHPSAEGGFSHGGHRLEPAALIDRALESGCPSISFTYSEPCLHVEYLIDSMELARKRGLKTILVTNGCINQEPAQRLLELCDAANVDLKSDSAIVYKEKLGGDLKIVQQFIQTAAGLCHLEITSLLVPGILDKPGQIEAIARFIASVSARIPLHITAYHPAFRWQEPSLSRKLAEAVAQPAFGLLEYVHLILPFPY